MIEPNTVQTQQAMAFPPLAGFEGSAQALMSTTKTAEQSIAVMLGNPASAANKGSADLGAVTGMIQAFTELVGKLVDLIASFAKMKGDTSDASKSSTPAGQSPSSSNPSSAANAASGGASSATPGSTAGSTNGSATGSATGTNSAAAQAPSTAGTQVGGACGCPKADASSAASAPATTTTTTSADPAAPAPTTAGRKAPDAGRLLGSTGQFLWKPVSEKDGKLAVLLPKDLTGKVKDVMVISPDKKTILQKGRYAGVGNGDRSHFRFSSAGAEFPDGAVVLIRLKNGESRHVVIKETSARATR